MSEESGPGKIRVIVKYKCITVTNMFKSNSKPFYYLHFSKYNRSCSVEIMCKENQRSGINGVHKHTFSFCFAGACMPR